jgi:hypothetical protein
MHPIGFAAQGEGRRVQAACYMTLGPKAVVAAGKAGISGNSGFVQLSQCGVDRRHPIFLLVWSDQTQSPHGIL